MLNEYHVKFLHHLARCGVTFLIIGGQATRFHCASHQTRDLDVWARMRDEDRPALEWAIVSWAQEHPQHAMRQNLVAPLALRHGVQIKFPEVDGVWFQDLSGAPQKVDVSDGIDVLTSLAGLDFDDSMQRAQPRDVRDVTVFTLAPADLDTAASARSGQTHKEGEPGKLG